MSVRILIGDDVACLYCSTTDVAFGPLFYADGSKSADERAEAFLRFLQIDARGLNDSDMQRQYGAWLAQEEKQYEREAAEEATCA